MSPGPWEASASSSVKWGCWPRRSLRRLLALTGHGFSIFLVWSKGSEEECALNRGDREEGKMHRERKKEATPEHPPTETKTFLKPTPVRTGRLAWLGQGNAYTSPAHFQSPKRSRHLECQGRRFESKGGQAVLCGLTLIWSCRLCFRSRRRRRDAVNCLATASTLKPHVCCVWGSPRVTDHLSCVGRASRAPIPS